MANPYGRCKACKERHSPGNCQGTADMGFTPKAVEISVKGFLAAVGDLAIHVDELLRFIEESKDPWSHHFKGGTVGGMHIKKTRKALRAAGWGAS